MRQIHYGEFLTGADADVLADTEFATCPGPGVVVVRAASSVNTATLAVKGSEHPEVSPARAVTLRANGEIQAGDPSWVLTVKKGEKVTVALAGTTGTTQIKATFIGG